MMKQGTSDLSNQFVSVTLRKESKMKVLMSRSLHVCPLNFFQLIQVHCNPMRDERHDSMNASHHSPEYSSVISRSRTESEGLCNVATV